MGTENDLPGISLKDEQRQLQNIIGIAQDNLDRAKESVKKLTDDLEGFKRCLRGAGQGGTCPVEQCDSAAS